jgi:2,5-diketo-D-gluconate reductase B
MPYVDLLLVHWPNDAIPIERTLDAMAALQEDEKTRHIGVSNFPPALFERAAAHAPLFCNQVEFHPYLAQQRVLEIARAHETMVTAYAPLARGLVGEEPVLQAIGEAHGKTPIQICLRWLTQQDGVAAIPKSSQVDHLRRNLEIFDFRLTEDEMAQIFGLARGSRYVDPDFAPAWGM